jgi:molecular chaperone GrpE
MSEQEKEIKIEDMNVENQTTEETQPTENVTEEVMNDIDKLELEVAEWKDKYMRLFAEFDNYKKRSFKEKMEVIQTAGKDLMLNLLEVLDDSDRAEKQMETATDVESVKNGIKLIINKLNNTLSSKGLKPFDSIGEVFDVEKHEAITEIPAPTPDMIGKVIDQVVKGYTLNDKLIRHAKVVVGKGENA